MCWRRMRGGRRNWYSVAGIPEVLAELEALADEVMAGLPDYDWGRMGRHVSRIAEFHFFCDPTVF